MTGASHLDQTSAGTPRWDRVMKLTREMLAGARRADWERVYSLQEERFALIREYFATSPDSAELDRIKPDVSALLDMDAEVAGLGDEARRLIAASLQRLGQGRAARKAYGK